jgi:hypothetical protein
MKLLIPMSYRWLLGVLILLAAATASPATLSGRVVGAYDGDTITVLDASRHACACCCVG